MLSKIFLENFKAFGQRTQIPLAPITLIYGENSAGKSSIMQALLLLKQTRESRELDTVLSPRLEGGFVDLGSFQELIFDHDQGKTLSIGLEARIETSKDDYFAKLFKLIGEASIEFKFSRPVLNSEIKLCEISIQGSNLDEPVASFTPMLPNAQLSPIVFSSSSKSVFAPAVDRFFVCKILTKNTLFWQPSYEQARNDRKAILKHLKEMESDLDRKGPKSRLLMAFGRPEKNKEAGNQFWSDLIDEYIRFFSEDFNIENWINFFHDKLSDGTVVLDRFLPVGSDISHGHRGVLLNYNAKHQFGRVDIPTLLPEPSTLLLQLSSQIEKKIDRIFPLGPFRRAPERYYIYTGSSPSDVGYKGNLMPDLLFRNKKLLKEANHWLDKLEIGYQLKIRSMGKGKDLFEMRLSDTKRSSSFDAGLTDVGFGVSQLLPFVVQSLAKSDQIITIEQPEVHIHPKLQADLGDLILHSYRGRLGNQFIIETHSEHIMLRFQKLVRQKKLRPSEICILYVSRGIDGSHVSRIRLDFEGELMDEWPGGFFPERIRELM